MQLLAAFEGLIKAGCLSWLFFISWKLIRASIDINIHPTKTEIKV